MIDDVRLDDLLIDDLKVYQRPDQFRFTFDTVALVHFCQFNPKFRYVDFGSGTGVIPLLGTSLGAGHMTGIEINPVTADLSRRSVVYNGREDRVTIVDGDYRRLTYEDLQDRPFDGVVVNPPYFDHRGGFSPDSKDANIALHDSHTSLDEICRAAKEFVKYRGRLWMIYTAPRLVNAITVLERYGFQIKRLRMIHGKAEKPAKTVMLEAVQGGAPGMRVEPPLIVYDARETYTEEVARWYGRTK